MLVMLKRPFFIKGYFFKPNPAGTDIPDTFRLDLPSDAKILKEAPKLPPKVEEPRTLSELAKRTAPDKRK